MKSLIIITLLEAAACLWGVAASTGATISGKVVDGTGNGATGVSITYHTVRQAVIGRNGLPVPSGALVSGSVQTGADGTFSIPNLDPGTYYLCAHPSLVGQVSACEWLGPDSTVSIGAGQNVNGVSFNLLQGTIVTFNISDPNGKIVDLADVPTNAGMLPLSGANFDLGVFSGRAYHKAARVSASATARTYQVTVPIDNSIRMFLNTKLAVTDANGKAITYGASAPLAGSGQTAVSVSLAVQ